MSWDVAVPAIVGAGVALLTQASQRILGAFFDRSAKLNAQRDADLVAIEQVVFEVRDLGTRYWSKDPDPDTDKVTAAAIDGRMMFLTEVTYELYEANQSAQRKVQIAVNRFDKSCTMGEFGSHLRKADADKCRDIEIAAYRLVHVAKAQRRKLRAFIVRRPFSRR